MDGCDGDGSDTTDAIAAEKAGETRDTVVTGVVPAAPAFAFALVFIFVDIHIRGIDAIFVIHGVIIIILVLIRIFCKVILVSSSRGGSGDL
jgi:hypothetical protein